MAHNRCLTHAWRRGKSPQSEAELPEIPDARKSPETLAIDNRRRETLVAAIRVLPVNYRQAITLALEDLTPGEIAAVLGVTENNVSVRLNRAAKHCGQSWRNAREYGFGIGRLANRLAGPPTLRCSDAASGPAPPDRARAPQNGFRTFRSVLGRRKSCCYFRLVCFHSTDMEWILWAAVIWAGTFFAAGFAVWNKSGTWKALSQSNAAFLDLSRQRCLRELRALRIGRWFLAVQLAIVAAWLSWDYAIRRLLMGPYFSRWRGDHCAGGG